MRLALRLGSAGLAALAAACAGPSFDGRRAEAAAHPEARFIVHYGDEVFRVNARYVDIIGESVIAVRRGPGEADLSDWRSMEVAPDVAVPDDAGFGDDAYRRVAVDIADAIQKRPPICSDGKTMRIATDENNEARTLYRHARQAWVVFALCPEGDG